MYECESSKQKNSTNAKGFLWRTNAVLSIVIEYETRSLPQAVENDKITLTTTELSPR